ncbi:uncharacterized protein LOC105685277 isoform X1 [Athalia rosae]|uniref:uncharacterized protein LOC105685277 isoform X1 n=1 Tax=Athalia rosae TaxID=37344 RepID=UPI002033CBFA|nr:uncharacterized protein LOC105685277 isoform X1 [Athalia rosae]
MATEVDKDFASQRRHRTANFRKLTPEALRKEALAAKCCTATSTAPAYDPNKVVLGVPSHVIKCKSKNSTMKTVVRPGTNGGSDTAGQVSVESPIPPRDENVRSIRKIKHLKRSAFSNKFKKILRKVPAGMGMGAEPPVAVAERPGKIPEKRGAIFSYAARDLRSQRNNAMAITKNAKPEKWYTAAEDYLSAATNGSTPNWK